MEVVGEDVPLRLGALDATLTLPSSAVDETLRRLHAELIEGEA